MKRGTDRPTAALLLDLPSRLYGGVMRLRNRYYNRPRSVRRVGVPVISVGNLTVGGTGKTPMVEWVCRFLQEQCARPAVVSRGYGGNAGRGPLIVSHGDGPCVDWRQSGDEPNLLAHSLPGVPVVVGSDRIAGAGAAIDLGATILVLDDGFQHRRLHRDLDIVLLDSSNPFGNYRMLPAGKLREPISGLGRADLVILTRARPLERFAVIEKVIRIHNPDAPIVHAGHRGLGFYLDDRPVAQPSRVVAFCAIGNPTRFRIELEAQGIEVVSFHVFRDHHPFAAAEIAMLEARAAELGAPLLTTAKDLARMPESTPAIVYRIATDPHEPELLREALERVVRGRR